MEFGAILTWIVTQGPLLVTAIVGVLSALVVLFSLIPGEQPEKAIQGVADFLKKFSKK